MNRVRLKIEELILDFDMSGPLKTKVDSETAHRSLVLTVSVCWNVALPFVLMYLNIAQLLPSLLSPLDAARSPILAPKVLLQNNISLNMTA